MTGDISFVQTLLNSGAALSPGGLSLERALLALLLSFVLGQLAAWVYIFTHVGVSYSRAFVQSLVLLTITVCLGIMVIGNNLFIAFGLIGALAVIRFRNILKDTRDTSFVFLVLVVGIASATGNYHLAVIGTLLFCGVLLYLHWVEFGIHFAGADGLIRFQVETGVSDRRSFQAVLDKYCRSASLISQRFYERGSGEVAYRLTMRDPARADELVEQFQKVEGISNVTFVVQEGEAEI
jgi:hypothetical protein